MKGTQSRSKLLAIPALILATGALAWFFFLRGPSAPEVTIAVSKRIESNDSAVASKTQDRIREITVREGDHVKAGQVIATLDDDSGQSARTTGTFGGR